MFHQADVNNFLKYFLFLLLGTFMSVCILFTTGCSIFSKDEADNANRSMGQTGTDQQTYQITNDMLPSHSQGFIPLSNLTSWGPSRDESVLDYATELNKAPINSNPHSDKVLGGDEREFVFIREVSEASRFSKRLQLEDNRTYHLYIYYRNNSDSDIFLENPRLSVDLRSAKQGESQIQATITSENQYPVVIWDSVSVQSNFYLPTYLVPTKISLFNEEKQLLDQEKSAELTTKLKNGVPLKCEKDSNIAPDCSGFAIIEMDAYTVRTTHLSSISTDENGFFAGRTTVDPKKLPKSITVKYEVYNDSHRDMNDLYIYVTPERVQYLELTNIRPNRKEGFAKEDQLVKDISEEDTLPYIYFEKIRSGEKVEVDFVFDVPSTWATKLCETDYIDILLVTKHDQGDWSNYGPKVWSNSESCN